MSLVNDAHSVHVTEFHRARRTSNPDSLFELSAHDTPTVAPFSESTTPLGAAGTTVGTGDHVTAWLPPDASAAHPVIIPVELIPAASPAAPPRVPRSTIPPADDHDTACSSDVQVVLWPTTVPTAFSPVAIVVEPPSDPMSTIPPPGDQKNVPIEPGLNSLPVTWPMSLMISPRL